ncbi:MAG TPA: TlpA disulfide reductase family protein [Spirochaetota bacterium]|nr:TlpA disulfide reductase family protein [Spirochaetota bacterium]
MEKRTFAIIMSLLMALLSTSIYSLERSAPTFALFDTQGKLVSLRSRLSKNNVVVAFFASYCVPCRKEIPDLIKIRDDNPGKFSLLLINIDREGKEKALPFLRGIGVSDQECLLDIYQQTALKYIPDLKVPAFFLIDKKGRILIESVGVNEGKLGELQKAAKRLR